MHLNETFERLDQDLRTLLSAPAGTKRIKITDLTPRDGQQCKLATRVSTDDLLPLCAALDNCGFYAVEVWGGASFDVCLRYLKGRSLGETEKNQGGHAQYQTSDALEGPAHPRL